MPKSAKPIEFIKKARSFYAVHPWECRHHKKYSEILAYVEASGKWEAVAVVQNTSGDSAEFIADFLCNLVNENQRNRSLLQDAMDALESVVNDGFTFSSEMAADRVVDRIKKANP